MKANIVYEIKSNGDKVFKFFTSNASIAQVYRDSVRRQTSWKKRQTNDLYENTIEVLAFEEKTLETALKKHGIQYSHDEFTLYTDVDQSNLVCQYTLLLDKVTDPIKILSSGGLHINTPKVSISFQKYPITDGDIYLLKDTQDRFYLTSCVTFNDKDYTRFNKLYSDLVYHLSCQMTVNRTYEQIIEMLKPVLKQYIINP